jgi:hypothetical protein
MSSAPHTPQAKKKRGRPAKRAVALESKDEQEERESGPIFVAGATGGTAATVMGATPVSGQPAAKLPRTAKTSQSGQVARRLDMSQTDGRGSAASVTNSLDQGFRTAESNSVDWATSDEMDYSAPPAFRDTPSKTKLGPASRLASAASRGAETQALAPTSSLSSFMGPTRSESLTMAVTAGSAMVRSRSVTPAGPGPKRA